MVLVVELLLALGVVAGIFKVATSDGDLAPAFEPDGPIRPTDERPLSAEDVAAFRLPWGVGYRKADVDRLLDRVARQLPRAGDERDDGQAHEPPAVPAGAGQSSGAGSPLTTPPHGTQEETRG